jgi:hypothetical protein
MLLALLSVLSACSSPESPSDTPDLTIEARDATYETIPNASIAILSFTLVIRNDSGREALAGCGMSIERDTGAGFELVVPGPCNGAVGPSETIPAKRQRIVQIARNIPVGALVGSARYRVTMQFAFGPEFSAAIPFSSQLFQVAELK